MKKSAIKNKDYGAGLDGLLTIDIIQFRHFFA